MRVYFPNVLGIAQHLVQEELETPVCSESLAKPQPTQPVLWGARAWNVIGRHKLGLSVTFKKQKDFSSLLNWLVWLGFLTGRMKTRVLHPPITCMFLFGGIPTLQKPQGDWLSRELVPWRCQRLRIGELKYSPLPTCAALGVSPGTPRSVCFPPTLPFPLPSSLPSCAGDGTRALSTRGL